LLTAEKFFDVLKFRGWQLSLLCQDATAFTSRKYNCAKMFENV